MKKRLSFIMCLLLLFSLTSCRAISSIIDSFLTPSENGGSNDNTDTEAKDPENNKQEEPEVVDQGDWRPSQTAKSGYHLVSFVYNSTKEPTTIEVKDGEDTYDVPKPTKEGYIFDCWCSDKNLTTEFKFSTDIKKDTILYAKYNVDYAYLTNKITRETMKANVVVTRNATSGRTTTISTGSGIIFDTKIIAGRTYYYCLTNNHVTYSAAVIKTYSVTDYLGNTMTAKLVAEDANYDLAIVKFEKGDAELLQITGVKENAPVGTEIVSLGQPENQTNAITYGVIKDYTQPSNLSNSNELQSNVSFDIIKHSAYMASGSSGGALLNTDLKLVGINYAGSTSSTGEFLHGYTIPIEKVYEFINKYPTSDNLSLDN